MNGLRLAELTRMRSTQSDSMQDTCQILVYGETFDTYHTPVEAYVTGSAIDCGFNPTASTETRIPDMTIVQVDATLRLPLGTSIAQKDKVRITHRFTEAITNQDYGVVGLPHIRPTCMFVLLEEVTG